MTNLDRPLRYSSVAMMLHWAIAALVLIEFGTAISFGHFNPGDSFFFPSAYGLHMSIGIVLLALSVLRVVWRLMHKFPAMSKDMSVASRALAHAAHALLYGYILVVPFTGWAVLSARKKPPTMFGSVHWPNIAFLADLSRESRVLIYKIALPTHIWLSYAGIGLIALHIFAALYHHYYRRDDVLRRMLPGTKVRPAHAKEAT